MTAQDLPRMPLPPARPRKADPLISLVVPCYAESEAIDAFIPAVDAALPQARIEFVFVNDGSRDDTLVKLLALSRGDPRVVVADLSRNFGKEIAMTAGLDLATGDVVVPMDADLQDPPELIAQFLERWREGYDVVHGVRADRSKDGRIKRATAQWFYRFFNRLASTEIPENVGDFRLMDRSVVDAVTQLPERSRFMKGLFAWVGFSSTGVEYARPERCAGTTKFGFWKLWNFALDGIVSFSTMPLRVWTYLGTLVALFSLVYGGYVIARTLIFGRDVPGYASLMVTVLFLGGIQLISLGIIGEYVSRLFVETKQRPLYLCQGVYRKGRDVSKRARAV
ncbi:glycosyltransferase family 2 protein [Limimaricola hongkongensis]|uniref:Glycosyltransferase n=1 Tax=Limimaricola hongkongensis DSM 17492 TaxID=1122180 RepID=A0A017H727_9RHOB|nr:glycosyltransferase family 2 protein [Limimaricola hongkongensis]EYD70352.1 Glycosyltransferase [Limimaricola hongkongensis DSM 17492]